MDISRKYNLSVFIVPLGLGSKVLSCIKKNGVHGGTVILALGSCSNKLARMLHLDKNHKEVVFVASNHEKSKRILKAISETFHFEKPNKGICFSMPLDQIFASKQAEIIEKQSDERELTTMSPYKAIYAIVNLGEGETVIKEASKAGAKGGTIIHARGSGIHETAKLFAVDVEPEKEIVLILVKNDIVEDVCQRILDHTDIHKPGFGIMFVQQVDQTYGLID